MMVGCRIDGAECTGPSHLAAVSRDWPTTKWWKQTSRVRAEYAMLVW